MWFVPAILTVYLLFPLYYHVFKTSNHKIQFTAMVFLVWLLISMLFANRIREDMFGFTNRIPVFLTGVLLGWIVRERESEFTTVSWAICVLALLLGLLLAYKTNYENMDLLVRVPNCCFPNLLMSVSGSCLLAGVFSLLDSHAVIVGRSLRAFFAFFGRMSLEFYCVQELLGEIIRKDILPGRGNPVTNVAVFAASTLAALALHHLCRMVSTIGEKQWTGTPA